jgi:hypothetical protein
MSRQTLTDSRNAILGYIETTSDGRQKIYSKTNVPLGVYDPKTNKTFNNNNQLIGTGNLLTSLLH